MSHTQWVFLEITVLSNQFLREVLRVAVIFRFDCILMSPPKINKVFYWQSKFHRSLWLVAHTFCIILQGFWLLAWINLNLSWVSANCTFRCINFLQCRSLIQVTWTVKIRFYLSTQAKAWYTLSYFCFQLHRVFNKNWSRRQNFRSRWWGYHSRRHDVWVG